MASNSLHQPSRLSSGTTSRAQLRVKNPDDVVIVSAIRTAITKGGKGAFKDTNPEVLLAAVLKGVVERVNLDPAMVDDIAVGTVLLPGGGAGLSRMAMLYAGYPESASVTTCNRQCSSGLQAVVQIATAIKDGTIDIGVGAGVDSMTKFYHTLGSTPAKDYNQEMLRQSNIADCLIPMGITSENVAHEFNVSREKQDLFSVASHQKAAMAQKLGLFDEEIIPVTTQIVDKSDGSKRTVVVSRDDGIRPETSMATLSKLKTVFKQDGTTTAGNASQISDGAGAVLLMKRSRAEEMGFSVEAKFITSAVVGVPPRVMGIGPAYAIPAAASKAGISVHDLDIVEINEAFASQAVYCVEKLGLDINKVNPKGGAIAFGHPLGATGARQISTLLTELKRTGKKIGATSMCMGTGMGMCAIFESEAEA